MHATASAINGSIILPLQSIQFRRVNPEGRTGGMRASRRAFCLLWQAERRGPDPPPLTLSLPPRLPPLLAKITHATLLLLPRLVGFASHPLPHPRVNVICQAGAARCGVGTTAGSWKSISQPASAPSFPQNTCSYNKQLTNTEHLLRKAEVAALRNYLSDLRMD